MKEDFVEEDKGKKVGQMEEKKRKRKMEMKKRDSVFSSEPLSACLSMLGLPLDEGFLRYYRWRKELCGLQSIWSPTDFTRLGIQKLVEVRFEVET